MEGKIRKNLIAVGGYPFASLHPLEGAAAQLSSHRRVGDFWRPAFGGRYRSGDALSGALAIRRLFNLSIHSQQNFELKSRRVSSPDDRKKRHNSSLPHLYHSESCERSRPIAPYTNS